MGAERLISAVADAGPLIHLSEIDCLNVLAVFDTIHIPGAVWHESVGAGRTPPSILTVTAVHQHDFPQSRVRQFVEDMSIRHLHRGECESLFACHTLGLTTLLTVDLAVRDVAKRMSITPVGSLGIVVRAYHLGRLSSSDAELFLARLHERSSLFVTRAIVEAAIAQLAADH